MPFFDARFDVGSVSELEKKLSRLPRPVENEVRKSNRKWAAKLRDLIRAEASALLGRGSRYGARHDTRPGAIRRSIRSRASGKSANVMGGGPAAPHFKVQEFGGSVYWYNARSGHSIPVKGRAADGTFFFPTAKDHAPTFGRYVADDAIRIVHDGLGN